MPEKIKNKQTIRYNSDKNFIVSLPSAKSVIQGFCAFPKGVNACPTTHWISVLVLQHRDGFFH